VVLHEVYLAFTIDCDYETAGTVLPNIGVLASNVTFRNVSGTVSPPRPRAEQEQEQQEQEQQEQQEQQPQRIIARGGGRADPSFLVDAAGTFFCRSTRPCSFRMEDVRITHADAANQTKPQWLCNNSRLLLDNQEGAHSTGAATISPPLPQECRHHGPEQQYLR